MMMLVWFTLSYGSYGIGTWSSTLFQDIGLGNPFLSSFIYTLANLPGNVISILYVEQVRFSSDLTYACSSWGRY